MEDITEKNTSKKLKSIEDSNSNSDSDLYVWPWMGIIANTPTNIENNRRVGESGTKLKEQLSQFNPLKVRPIWNYKGHTGFAIVEFRRDWYGFKDAMDFQSHFEIQNKGKKEFEGWGEKEGIYGWMARREDYEGTGSVRDYLVKNGDLKRIGDVQCGETVMNDKVVSCLANEIWTKNRNLQELERKYLENQMVFEKNMKERDEMLRVYSEEKQRMEKFSNYHLRGIIEENLKLQASLELKMKEAQETNQKLLFEKKISSGSLSEITKEMRAIELATIEKQKADEKVWKLVQAHKKEKEETMKKILELEKQVHAKQNLELEIHQLKTQLENIEALESFGHEDDPEQKEKMESMKEELREKVDELEGMESLNQTLIIKESRSHEELHEARIELIKGLGEVSSYITIGIKNMGEINKEAFQKACEIKFHRSNVEKEVELLVQKWQDEIKDPNWHPFEPEFLNGSTMKEVIDEEDEKLQELKKSLGDEAYEAVITALMEIKEYNPVPKCPVPEIWNFRENRKATMEEAIRFTLNSWKLHMKKRARTEACYGGLSWGELFGNRSDMI